MKRFALILTTILSIQLYSWSIFGDGKEASGDVVSVKGRALLTRGEGVVDDAVFHHIAAGLSVADFRAAIYGGNRAHRRVALDAAAFVADPWEYIPWLISFMGAAERQSASVAAESLFTALEREFDMQGAMGVPIPRQAKQLIKMLQTLADDESLDLDIRVSAIRLMAKMVNTTGQPLGEMQHLLGQSAPEIRVAAMHTLSLPLNDVHLTLVGTIATEDDSAMVRGAAVTLLCENARSHKVTKPSSDLKALVADLVDADIGAEFVAPALTCIARFPYQTRADLSDRINRCENEKIVKYWKTLAR